MKKLISLAVLMILAVGFASAQSGRLTVWSFTDELGGLVNDYYAKAFPNVRINYSMTPTELFPSRLDPVLASGVGAPDVFSLESAFVRKYVESGYLLDLTDIYEANKNKMLAYPVEVGTHNDRVYALSWEACTGAMFYRRSLARKYLGTDDPAAVQLYFANMSKFLETAYLLNQRSNGTCVIVSSLEDIIRPFMFARSQPWVIDGRFFIDPAVEQLMDIVKELYEKELTGGIGQWSESWFVGMTDELRNKNGQRLETFAYFLPTWGLDFVLKPNSPQTLGDWAMIQGPVPYYWGGTWLAAWKDTPNAETAKEFIRYITTNDNFMETYTRALGNTLGEIINNTNVINKIKNNYSDPFLAGQNHFAAFADISLNVNGKLDQSSDYFIMDIFYKILDDYMKDQKSKAQALADFREQVRIQTGIR